MVGGIRNHTSYDVFATTPRLQITGWCSSDVDDYAQLVGDEQVMRFIGNGESRNREKAEAEISGFIAHEKEHGFSRWAIREEKRGLFVGMVGFMMRDGEVDFGGRIGRRFWGGGYAAEGLVYALKLGFEERGVSRASTITDERNVRAWKLNEKFGLDYEGNLPISGVSHIKQSIDAQRYWDKNVFANARSILDPIVKREEMRGKRLPEAP